MSNFHQRWAGLKPPLRPNEEVVAAVRSAIEGHESRVLLLGVTPELSVIGKTLVAVDMSQKMLEMVWPGDTDTRHAVCGNWLSMPLHVREFTAVIGDASFAFMELTAYTALFEQLGGLLLPGASFAMRFYETPTRCETVAELRDDVMSGSSTGFHAFKWRLAMAIVAEAGNANIPVVLIHRTFEHWFNDRQALSAATGWSLASITEIDCYEGQDSVFSFPTRCEILASVPRRFSNPRFIESGSYELAERCPILLADFVE